MVLVLLVRHKAGGKPWQLGAIHAIPQVLLDVWGGSGFGATTAPLAQFGKDDVLLGGYVCLD